ncbi:MAG: trans-aconitate 2-methyltransferase [Vicinamibacterales bacterium]
METFSPAWLALREPADVAARSEALTRLAGDRLALRRGHRAIDLACGTGANVRYLTARLPVVPTWTIVDHDQALLAEARRQLGNGPLGPDYTLTARRLDLADLDPAVVAGHDLVTASALLDLVSAAWLETLARACRSAEAVVLLALTFDGRMECTPPHPDDELVRGLVLRHQRHDKGFGPALGPDAASVAEVCFATAGFTVRTAHSDWQLESPRLQRELVAGWARAAVEIDPAQASRIAAWEARRLAHVLEGRSRIRVGHRDLVAWR